MFSKSKNKSKPPQQPQGQPGEPSFAGPSSRLPFEPVARARVDRELSLKGRTDKLIGCCVEWRKLQQTHVKRSATESQKRTLEETRRGIVKEASQIARWTVSDNGYRKAKELIDRISQYLTVSGERPSVELAQLIDTWQAPAETAEERLTQLKSFRYKMSLAELVQRFTNLDDLNLRSFLIPVVERWDELQKCPVVQAQEERAHKANVWPLRDAWILAESDFTSTCAVLDQWVERPDNHRLLSSQETQALEKALVSALGA